MSDKITLTKECSKKKLLQAVSNTQNFMADLIDEMTKEEWDEQFGEGAWEEDFGDKE